PRSLSSASTWRPIVGWLSDRARAAPESEPCSTTAAKLRQSAQSGSLFILECRTHDLGECPYDSVGVMLLSITAMEQIMSKGNVTILGSNGHIGHAAMLAFRGAGWSVTGFGRANRKPVDGTRFVQGDANDIGAVKKAIAEADVVVNGLHLRYDQWGNGRAEAQLQVVIDAMSGTGK